MLTIRDMIQVNFMDPLPTGNNPANAGNPMPPTGSIAKEKEGGSSVGEILKPVGAEVELAPELSAAGVKVQPASVQVPPAVSQMGVTPVGQVVTAAPAVTLPLTNDQIAAGLHQSVTNSWRWLAEWCMRILKKKRRYE